MSMMVLAARHGGVGELDSRLASLGQLFSVSRAESGLSVLSAFYKLCHSSPLAVCFFRCFSLSFYTLSNQLCQLFGVVETTVNHRCFARQDATSIQTTDTAEELVKQHGAPVSIPGKRLEKYAREQE